MTPVPSYVGSDHVIDPLDDLRSTVPNPEHRTGLFPALLKDWRRRRGLSQLDLAVVSDVSARHISFLETGRSRPSREMVVQLATALALPLRQVNAMLRAAGHEPAYDESGDGLPPVVTDALALLKTHHEPFPLVVVDRAYRVLDLNGGALALFGSLLGAAGSPPLDVAGVVHLGLNLARLTFDPAGAQPQLANFDEVGRQLLWRIQRELLADPGDDELRELLDDLLAMPTVDPDWRQPDLQARSDPALVLHLRLGDVELRFLTMITAFQAPQNVAVDHLRIETWFPADEATAATCTLLAQPADRR